MGASTTDDASTPTAAIGSYAGSYPAWFYQQDVYFVMGADGLWYGSGIRQSFSDVPSQYRVITRRGICSRRRLQCLDMVFWGLY